MLIESFQLQGQRPYQEDSFHIDQKHEFFLVCDGMGGSSHGDLASKTISEFIQRQIRQEGKPFSKENEIQQLLQQAWTDLMQRAKEKPEAYRMGTTLIGAFFTQRGIWTVNVGDSRLYHVRPEKGILWCSKDHSLVQEMFDKGLFEHKEEMEKDPRSNQLTRAFVAAEDHGVPEADLHFIEDIRTSDIFMLCSDGVIETFKGDRVVPILSSREISLEEKKNKIEQECREKSSDNSTAIFIQIE